MKRAKPWPKNTKPTVQVFKNFQRITYIYSCHSGLPFVRSYYEGGTGINQKKKNKSNPQAVVAVPMNNNHRPAPVHRKKIQKAAEILGPIPVVRKASSRVVRPVATKVENQIRNLTIKTNPIVERENRKTKPVVLKIPGISKAKSRRQVSGNGE